MNWRPIEDLPQDWKKLASSELLGLIGIWKDQRSRLGQLDAVKDFNLKLQREWAIETGIIENLYTLDRGVTQLLIEKGFSADLVSSSSTNKPVGLVVNMLNDHEAVFQGLLDMIGASRELTTSYINQMHQEFTKHQVSTTAKDAEGNLIEIPLLRGAYKKRPNNPQRTNGQIHEYCPPEHVVSEMDRLLEMHRKHVDQNIPPEIEAAWLHHRFTQIHPYQDGNGRIARTLASLILLKGHCFPLLIRRDIRSEYIDACESADRGDLKPLIDIIVSTQKQSFLKVLSIADHLIEKIGRKQEMLDEIRERIQKREAIKKRKIERVFQTADTIKSKIFAKLTDLCAGIQPILSDTETGGSCNVFESKEDQGHWYKGQIVHLARNHGYFADLSTYHQWVRLRIREMRDVNVIVSLHSLGYEFIGMVAISAFIEFRDLESDHSTPDGPYALCKEILQFSYQENEDDVNARFEEWFDKVQLVALDNWRKQL